jgi:hypothetical protein
LIERRFNKELSRPHSLAGKESDDEEVKTK